MLCKIMVLLTGLAMTSILGMGQGLLGELSNADLFKKLKEYTDDALRCERVLVQAQQQDPNHDYKTIKRLQTRVNILDQELAIRKTRANSCKSIVDDKTNCVIL